MAQSREVALLRRYVARELGDWSAYDEIALPLDKLKRLASLNQSLYSDTKFIWPGCSFPAKRARIRTAFDRGPLPVLRRTGHRFCAQCRRIQSQRPDRQMLLRRVAAKVAQIKYAFGERKCSAPRLSPAFSARATRVVDNFSARVATRTGFFDIEAFRLAVASVFQMRYRYRALSLDLRPAVSSPHNCGTILLRRRTRRLPTGPPKVVGKPDRRPGLWLDCRSVLRGWAVSECNISSIRQAVIVFRRCGDEVQRFRFVEKPSRFISSTLLNFYRPSSQRWPASRART